MNHFDYEWSCVNGEVSSLDLQRIKRLVSLIPESDSILDAGCGDGRVLKRLYNFTRKVGFDISAEALKRVDTESYCGNLVAMPFQDREFETVLCAETIEHLSFQDYPQALSEIARVSSKYIVLSVPNNENMKKARVLCPLCGCVFHADRHVRTYTEKTMPVLNGFKMVKCERIIQAKSYPDIIFYLAFELGRGSFPNKVVCPQCDYSTEKPHGLAKAKSLLRFIPKVSKYQWLVGVYNRI